MKKLLTLLTAALVATSVFAGEFPDVSISEVAKLSENKKAVIIDVNGTKSYKAGHVPGAGGGHAAPARADAEQQDHRGA